MEAWKAKYFDEDATRTLKIPDGTSEEITMTNWHWHVWDEIKERGFSHRSLLEEVIALDTDNQGTAHSLMLFLQVYIEDEKANLTDA